MASKLPVVPLSDLEQDERSLLERLAKGEHEIASGEGHDLDEVLSEVDALLRERDE